MLNKDLENIYGKSSKPKSQDKTRYRKPGCDLIGRIPV
jgi:hypothetical protein